MRRKFVAMGFAVTAVALLGSSPSDAGCDALCAESVGEEVQDPVVYLLELERSTSLFSERDIDPFMYSQAVSGGTSGRISSRAEKDRNLLELMAYGAALGVVTSLIADGGDDLGLYTGLGASLGLIGYFLAPVE